MNKDCKHLRVQNTFWSNQWLYPCSIKSFRKSLKTQQIWVGTEREVFPYKRAPLKYPLIISTDVCYTAQLQWYDNIFPISIGSDWTHLNLLPPFLWTFKLNSSNSSVTYGKINVNIHAHKIFVYVLARYVTIAPHPMLSASNKEASMI